MFSITKCLFGCLVSFIRISDDILPQVPGPYLFERHSRNVAQKGGEMALRLNTGVKTIERQLRKIPFVHYEESARKGE